MQTSESQTSTAGIAGSILEGGINLGKDYVDRTGRAAAAGTLTNGNAGRLPAAGYASRADLASALTDAKMDASKALSATPYSANAKSTQQLTTTLEATKSLGKAAGLVGTALGPAVGAYEGFNATPESATTGERWANAVGGGLKEVDDASVSAFAGSVAALGAVMAGTAISSGGVTLPAGAAVIVSAPAVGTGAAIAASSKYDVSTVDTVIDNWVDNSFEPAVASAIDTTIDTYESTKSWAGETYESTRSLGKSTLNTIESWFR